MKILLINKFHFRKGGAERAYFDTAQILEKYGHEIAFFSMQHPDNEPTKWSRYFVSEADYHASSYSIFQKIRIVKNILWNREAQKNLERLIREFQPDVAHLHNIYHQLSPSILWTLKKHGIPMTMTLHDHKVVCPQYNMFVRGKIWEKRPYQCIVDRCVQNSLMKSIVCTVEHYLHALLGSYSLVNAYISPSKHHAQELSKHGFKKPIQHVFQPVAQQFFGLYDPSKTPLKPGEDIHLLYVGRLSPEKGVQTVIEAMANTSGNIYLHIVGTGPQERKLKKYVKTLRLTAKIKFYGFLDGEDLLMRYSQAHAIVLPSLVRENMPYTMIEALAAGKMFIGSNLGGMAEVIIHGRNGFLFPAGSAKALTRCIDTVRTSDTRSIIEEAQKTAQTFKSNIYYQKLRAIYKSILS